MVAIEEELLHISAPSRLDYFKSGCQFDKRVAEKRKQFHSAAEHFTSCDDLEASTTSLKKAKVEARQRPPAVQASD